MWYAFGAGVHSRHRVGEDVDIKEAALYIELCRKFQAETGVVAFPAPVPAISDHDFWGKIKQLIGIGQSPDVVYVHYSWFPDAVKQGLLLDLTPYLPTIGISLDQFYPNAITQFRSGERLFAIPRETSSIVLYYNRSLFEKKGIPEPGTLFREDRWTWDTFREIAQALSGDGDFGCVAPVTVPYALLPLIYSFGGTVVNEAQDHCTFDDERTMEAIRFMREMIEQGYAVSPDRAREENLFAAGRVGMFCSGFWEVAVLNSSNVPFDWDVAHLPKGERRVTRVASGGYAIPTAALRRDDGLRFIQYAVRPSELTELGKSGLLIPALTKAAESPEWLQEGRPPQNRRVFLEALAYGVNDPISTAWPSMIEIIDTELRGVWRGEKTVSAGCQEITNMINRILERE